MLQDLETLVELGFSAVLTSGGQGTAVQGREMLKRLVEAAAGRIEIVVGGGVRSGNVKGSKEETDARWWHSSCIVQEGGKMADEEEMRALGEVVRGFDRFRL